MFALNVLVWTLCLCSLLPPTTAQQSGNKTIIVANYTYTSGNEIIIVTNYTFTNYTASQSSNTSSYANYTGSQTSNITTYANYTEIQWNYTVWSSVFYYEEVQTWDYTLWYENFLRVNSITWNYTAWYSHMLGSLQDGFTCEANLIVQVETAVILNIFDSLTKPFSNRSNSCKWLKESILLSKSILQKCKAQETVLSAWESSSRISVLYYSLMANIREFETIYRLVSSASLEDSVFSSDSWDIVIGGSGEAQCNVNEMRASLLALAHLEFKWDDVRVCRDVTQAVEDVSVKLSSCGWEMRSTLSMLLSTKQSMKNIICTPPSCNVQYATLCLANAELFWHAHEQEVTLNMTLSLTNITAVSLNNSVLASSRNSVCRNLKLGIACVTNHTLDCQQSIYGSISSRFEKVNIIYKELCPEFVPAPRNCSVQTSETAETEIQLKPNIMNVSRVMESSLIFNRSDLCRAVLANNGSQDLLQNYCYGPSCRCNLTVVQDVLMKNTSNCYKDDLLNIMTNITGCSISEIQNLIANSSNLQSCTALKDILLSLPSCESPCPTFPQLKQLCNQTNNNYCQQQAMTCFSKNVLRCSKSELSSHLLGITDLVSGSCNNKTATKMVLQSSEISVFTDIINQFEFLQCVALLKNNTSDTVPEILAAILECFSWQQFTNAKIEKLESFLNYILQNSISGSQMCADDSPFKSLIYNTSMSIITESQDFVTCGSAQTVIDTWFSKCSQKIQFKANISEIISAVCQKEVIQQMSNCSYDNVYSCFHSSSRNNLNAVQLLQRLENCTIQYAMMCKSPLSAEYVSLARNLSLAFGLNTSLLNQTKSTSTITSTGNCGCDPPAAINCILDVHHMAKQPFPDWEGICLLLPESKNCAFSYVSECDECKRTTVMSIVTKLNSRLEEQCVAPPITTCPETRAMKCVTDLSSFQERSANFNSSSICIQITVARGCVYETTKGCDELTKLSVQKSLEQVILQWKNLKCNALEEQLTSCLDIFQSKIYSVLGLDLYQLSLAVSSQNSIVRIQIASLCEEIQVSWKCVNATLNLQTDNIQGIIVRKSIQVLYSALQEICKPKTDALQCYSCQGEGKESCENGMDIETCKENQVCETVIGSGRPSSRGCKPAPACKPGCFNKKCTYCCSSSLCNNLDNGPIEGYCNMTALASCVLDLSSEYMRSKNIQCSSASSALECIHDKKAVCELGGMRTFVSTMSSLNISAEVTVCLIQEANQTCDLGPISTTAVLINTNGLVMSKDDLCLAVNESRKRISQAETYCVSDQVTDFRQTQLSLETMIGYLNCTEKYNFTVEEKCRILDALSCFENIKITNENSCYLYNETIKCVRDAVKFCTSACQLVQVNLKMEALKSIYAQVCQLDVNITDVDLPQKELAQCISNFTESIRKVRDRGQIVSITEAIANLSVCFSTFGSDVLNNTVENIYIIEIMNIIDIIIDLNINVTIEVTSTCAYNLSTLLMYHGEKAFTLPFLPLSQREVVCSKFDDQDVLQAVAVNCNSSSISSHYELVDAIREKFVLGFCPEIKPVPRCLVSRAKECVISFQSLFSLNTSDNLCLDAKAMVDCAFDYTVSCSYDEVKEFHSYALFTSEIVTQTCYDDAALIKKARCGLLGRIEAQPGCMSSAPCLSTNNTGLYHCSESEKQAACIISTSGSCLNQSWDDILKKQISQIAECRYGNPNANVTLTSSCSQPPFECNYDQAQLCLTLINMADQTSLSLVAQCLEKHYYCFTPVTVLISGNITQYITVIYNILSITPHWEKLESKQLIDILTTPSYILNFLHLNLSVSLNLWDVCWRMSNIFSYLLSIQDMYPGNVFPAINLTLINMEKAMEEICVPEKADLTLEFPDNGEESLECPTAQVKAELNVLMSLALAQFYSPPHRNDRSFCSSYLQLKEKFDDKVSVSCSSGFNEQVRFSLNAIQSVVRNVCLSEQPELKRCDISMVQECVNTLYKSIQNLGKTQNIIDLCQVLEKTDICVERFSYKCDGCKMSRIELMYKSVRQSAAEKCAIEDAETVSCPENRPEEPLTKCDIKKASKCGLNQCKLMANIFKKNKDKCKSLSEQLDCVQKYTAKCDSWLIPKLSLLDAKFVEGVKKKYGCEEDKKVKVNFGCRQGCWINEANKCFEVFYKHVPKRMARIKKDSCQYLNDLKFCISINTTHCTSDESKQINAVLSSILRKFPDHESTCIDVLKCAKDFDQVVRLIKNLQPEEDISETGKVQTKGQENNDEDDDEEEDDDNSDSSNDSNTFDGVCVKARAAWDCLGKGLEDLPKEKRNVLRLMYEPIWQFVTDKCTDTREFSCYYCKNKKSAEECTATTICPDNKRTCMFKQILTGNGVKYSAGCSPVSACKNKAAGNQRTTCCTTSLCNTILPNTTSVINEPEQCQLESALECALDFVIHYVKSDGVLCKDVTANLGCIQKYGRSCTQANSLIKASNEAFLFLAKTKCLIDAPNDCNSLALQSIQTVLSSSYAMQGNSPCLALNETARTVRELIASESCSESGKISLQQTLEFMATIVQSYCYKDQCLDSKAESDLVSSSQCSGQIFGGIKHIYRGFDEFARGPDRRCGECASNVLKARKYLNNCQLSNLVNDKLNKLDTQVQTTCGMKPQVELPKICATSCQVDKIFDFTETIITQLRAQTKIDLQCWYLTQESEAYKAYTSGCSAFQQRDVINHIKYILGAYIDECQAENVDFVFQLELKEDIYYSTASCLSTFQKAVQIAFEENSQEKTCLALAELRNCDWNLPDLIEDFITGPAKECIENLDAAKICSDIGNDRSKRDAPTCKLKRLTSLIFQMSIPPHIASAPLESRSIYCQDINAIIEEAKTLVELCGSALSTFQRLLYNIFRSNLEIQQQKFCPDLTYEEEKCDLNMTVACRKDFEIVSQYAAVNTETVCRLGKFNLECTARFTSNCTTVKEMEKARSIQLATKLLVKQSVGNRCPLLTPFLYCNDTLSVLEPACRLNEAKNCMSLADFDFTKSTDPVFCQYLQNNVSCVQRAMNGCQSDQIKGLGWAGKMKQGFCNIADASLNNVCVSTPVCPSKSIANCFVPSPSNCSSLQKAISCANEILSANKACSDSWGAFIQRNFLSTFYMKLYYNCNMVSDVTAPQSYDSSCLLIFIKDLENALITKYRSRDELFKYSYYRLVSCLDTREKINPIISLLYNISVQLYNLIPKEVNLVTYNSQVDEHFIDTETCFYSQAKACITKQILQVTAVQLLNGDEKNELCDSWTQNTAKVCVEQSLSQCASDRSWYVGITTYINDVISGLEICAPPQLCIVSEAFECVSKLATALGSYDVTNDKEMLCQVRVTYQECLDSFLFKCSVNEAKPARDAFKVLYSKAETICKDIVLPPAPLCPQIPDRNRVCFYGNAFRCVTKFNTKILQTGDSLIWRQQCLDIQSMIVCVATNTTSCDPESQDVATIRDSLDDFRYTAQGQCPWLSNDLCTEEEICPVVTAGCEIELEHGLINRVKTVCELKQTAVDCVTLNTATCNRAQKAQAISIIEKKLQAVGLPKDISCENSSIDGCLYSFLSAARDIYFDDKRNESCRILNSQYKCIYTRISNPKNSSYVDLGRRLLGDIQSRLNASLCTDANNTCRQTLSLQKLSPFISQLLLNPDFHNTSFCAQSLSIAQDIKANDCNSGLKEIIANSAAFTQKCNDTVNCLVAEQKIQQCLKDFERSDCFNNQAALCITNNLPSTCPYKDEWISKQLCNKTIVLRPTGQQNSKNFISEAGLSVSVSWELKSSYRDFKIFMTAKPVNSSTIPRCLGGSQVNDPIPQIYTDANPKKLEANNSEFKFRIYARQDYKQDGPQSIQVDFTIIPYEILNATTQDITEESFKMSSLIIEVDDRDVKKSLCTSINDPHINTFDAMKYNNMLLNKFILYRHKYHPVSVIVQFAKCAAYGTCNCGIEVYTEHSVMALSYCEYDNFIRYELLSGATIQEEQDIIFFKDPSLKTYYIIVRATGTIIRVVASDTYYLIIAILPSAEDFGATEGLCGVYDGDGYNDFELPNSKLYKVTDEDTDYMVLTPDGFSKAWQISNTSDLASVFAPGVVMSNASATKYCYGWSDSINCSTYGHVATCGFVTGEDQTAQLLEMLHQTQSKGGKRKKRQAETPMADPAVNGSQSNGWPTSTGWTLENATLYCLDNLFNKPLQACKDTLAAIDQTLKQLNFDDPVETCIDDIRLSGSTIWLDGARQAASLLCLMEINHNPEYQNQQQSSDLAMAFLNLTCIPFDCNKHGTCNKGQCICSTGYFGTSCNQTMDQLIPPQLDVPDGNIHMCKISARSDCSAVYLTGSGFISSSLLSCHIKESVAGVTRTSVVSAYLLSKDLVRCNLGTKSSMKKLLQVSVSNDGRNPDPLYQSYLAYDPICYSCNMLTCTKNTGVCFIGTTCVPEGEKSVYNDCQYCDLLNPNQWTVDTNVPGCKVEKTSGPEKEYSLVTTALIATGATLVALLIILVIALFVYLRRRFAARKRETAALHKYVNAAYQDNPPFYGQPILAHNTRSDSFGNFIKTNDSA